MWHKFCSYQLYALEPVTAVYEASLSPFSSVLVCVVCWQTARPNIVLTGIYLVLNGENTQNAILERLLHLYKFVEAWNKIEFMWNETKTCQNRMEFSSTEIFRQHNEEVNCMYPFVQPPESSKRHTVIGIW